MPRVYEIYVCVMWQKKTQTHRQEFEPLIFRRHLLSETVRFTRFSVGKNRINIFQRNLSKI